MRTIGLIGGTSWQSTEIYYHQINEGVNRALGGLHSAKIVLYSVDFAEFESRMRSDDWDWIAEELLERAISLQNAGASCILLCSNTMHVVADQIASEIRVPLLHIVDAAAAAITEAGFKTVGLLGTNFLVENGYFQRRLERNGIRTVIPNFADQMLIHNTIFDELCKGVIHDATRALLINAITRLAEQGCEGIILGCTELGLLVKQPNSPLPLFDTTNLHAEAAVQFALSPFEK